MTVSRSVSILSCVAVLLLTTIPALASDPQISLLGGAQFSWAPFENSAVFGRGELDHHSITGVLIGGTVRTSFGYPGSFSFEPGAFYCRRGGDSMWEMIGTNEAGTEIPLKNHMSWRISYLALPLHARLDMGRGNIRPFVKVGPEIGLRLSATHEEPTLDLGGGQMEYVERDATDDIRLLDFGFSFAAGVQVPIGGIPALVQAGYYHGLVDILDPDSAIEDAKLKNRSIAILIGLVLQGTRG